MRIIGLFVLLFYTNLLVAQETTTHKVRPGETFSSIAEKYDISESILRAENVLTPECYVGATLRIPSNTMPIMEVKTAHEESDVILDVDPPMPDRNDYVAIPYSPEMEALSLMRNGKLNKARTVLTKAIKLTPQSSSYYYRGLCNFRDGKWKSAINDLNVALQDNSLPYSLKSDAESMLETAQIRREEQLEKRREAWTAVGAAVGTAVLVAGVVAADAYLYSQTGSSTFSPSTNYSSPALTSAPVSFSSMSTTEFDEYVNREMQRLWDLTVAQVNQQNQQEYQQFCMFYKDAEGNPLYTYDEWYAMKAAAWAQSQQTVGSTTDDGVGSSYEPSSGVNEYVQKVRDSNPYGNKDCPMCAGTGICQTCNGSGLQESGFGLGRLPCANCYVQNGVKTGKCGKCHGTGTVYGHTGI